jgi:hypothetical protein
MSHAAGTLKPDPPAHRGDSTTSAGHVSPTGLGCAVDYARRIDVRDRDHSAERAARLALATPLPLGFLALAAGTLLLAGVQLAWIEQAQGDEAALIILGFLTQDVGVGTGMGILRRGGDDA